LSNTQAGERIPHLGDAAKLRCPIVLSLQDSMTNPPSKHTLHARYGLSAAEAQIAIAISEGADLQAIAAARAASVQTVRSQLKAIFRKTGATSQARLVALILRP